MLIGVSWIRAKFRLERSAARSDERIRIIGRLRGERRGHHVPRKVSLAQSKSTDQVPR